MTTECTDCDTPVMGGFAWRQWHGHLHCIMPYVAAALIYSGWISVREFEQAVELLDLFVRGHRSDLQRRDRYAANARNLRIVAGLPPVRGLEEP